MRGFLRVADVAGQFDVSMRTVLRWVERGEIAAVRLPGGGLRIPQTAVDRFIADHTIPEAARTLEAVEPGG